MQRETNKCKKNDYSVVKVWLPGNKKYTEK